MNIRLTLLALAAYAASPDAASAQAVPKCGDLDQQEVITEWHDLAADADGFFELDADGLHVEPEFWAALDLTRKKTLMIGADVYHECVIWPDLIDNGTDPAKRMWLCGIEVYRRDADWENWRNPPKPIAETLPGKYGGCEFRIDGVPAGIAVRQISVFKSRLAISSLDNLQCDSGSSFSKKESSASRKSTYPATAISVFQ